MINSSKRKSLRFDAKLTYRVNYDAPVHGGLVDIFGYIRKNFFDTLSFNTKLFLLVFFFFLINIFFSFNSSKRKSLRFDAKLTYWVNYDAQVHGGW